MAFGGHVGMVHESVSGQGGGRHFTLGVQVGGTTTWIGDGVGLARWAGAGECDAAGDVEGEAVDAGVVGAATVGGGDACGDPAGTPGLPSVEAAGVGVAVGDGVVVFRLTAGCEGARPRARAMPPPTRARATTASTARRRPLVMLRNIVIRCAPQVYTSDCTSRARQLVIPVLSRTLHMDLTGICIRVPTLCA